jgi:tRNA G18 (ribose-2'-O)-methylase SpoU
MSSWGDGEEEGAAGGVRRQDSNRSIEREGYAKLPRYSLIVCAVLVQNPANLGGLCRTCEAFRLEALVLADLALSQTTAFRNLAVSTHHWQPLIACPIDRLSAWLGTQQAAGYSLVGLDTVSSRDIALPNFVFPRRSVLILGQELTGIPSDILSLCDHLVTIPQFGLVESLNVQTAGSIATYEYLRQLHLCDKANF